MISLNSLGYPLEKNAIHSNSSGFPFKKTVIRSKGWGYPARNKLSSTWTAQVINSKQLSAALLFQTTFNQTVCANLSKNVSLNNSSKRCLLSSHEFSRYIFCWSLLYFHNVSLIFIGPVVSWVPCLTLCDQSQFLFVTMILSNRTSSGVIIT